MKKTSFANLIIVIGLLILCVMTLIAVYATAPESSVLLLDETFTDLNETKWRHEISECTEGGEILHYDIENEKTSQLIADGILHLRPNLTSVEFRGKRETFKNWESYNESKNPSGECDSSLFLAKVETTNVMDANKGRIKLRAKLQSKNPMRLCVEFKSNFNSSNSEEVLDSFLTSEKDINKSNFSELRILFKSLPNEAIINSEIIDREYHTYEINWDSNKISLKIDDEEVEEKQFKVIDLAEENSSEKAAKFNVSPISQPFYLKVGVEFEKNELKDLKLKRNFNKNEEEIDDDNVFQMDYIQLLKILN